MHRLEDQRLLTGRGDFTDDHAAPGALWGVLVRSPHAHAAVVSIDAAPAMALPGARLVLTGADLVAEGVKPIAAAPRLTDAEGKPPRAAPWESLATTRVRHVGQAVALCVADSASTAIDMAEAVAVDWRPLPAVTDVRRAAAPGAPQLWPDIPDNVSFRWGLGDRAAVAAAFRAAAHVVEVADVVSQRVVMAPLEPRAAVARFDAATGGFHLHTGNQGTTQVRDQLAAVLGVAKEKVLVTTADTGGAFGMRSSVYPEYPALCVAARRLGAPVRWTATRSEAFVSDAQARDSVMSGRIALDADARILALDIRSLAAMGGSMHPLGYFIAVANFSRCIPGPYRVPALATEVTCVLTNTVPTAPYRGAGRPEAACITEALIEAAARHLRLDAIELRRRNLIAADAFPHETAAGTTYDSGDFPTVLAKAVAAADWVGFPARRKASEAKGRARGIGLGMFVEIAGGVPTERAKMRLLADGRIETRTALAASGQGHQTIMGLIAAEQIGLPFERMVVDQGSSAGFADGGSSTAARSTLMAGMAIRGAARALLDEARGRAATRLGVAPEKLEWKDGRFEVPGTNLAIGIEALADGPPLEVDVRIEQEPSWPNGAHVAEVEIDPDTGAVTLARYTAVDDSGRIIAPHFAEGQIHGALAQGIGQVLMEHGAYDDATGQLIAGSFMDYTMPRADDLPRFNSSFHPVPARSNPLGVKGVGESGTVGALPTVRNAVLDALATLGVARLEMPYTPARVWRAIRDARR